MAAVTLLALGNGAPDVFSSVAAVASGNPRTGFGAILSAGTFVSGFVVGFVGIYAAPFCVDPSSFVRDVLFYLMAAFLLFYVYLSGELYFWQAIGFVGFYIFFVAFVFWMDFGSGSRKVEDVEAHTSEEVLLDSKKVDQIHEHSPVLFTSLKKVCNLVFYSIELILQQCVGFMHLI